MTAVQGDTKDRDDVGAASALAAEQPTYSQMPSGLRELLNGHTVSLQCSLW